MGKLGVKATDDKHIEFTLKNKAAYFPYILTLWTGWPSRQDLVDAVVTISDYFLLPRLRGFFADALEVDLRPFVIKRSTTSMNRRSARARAFRM